MQIDNMKASVDFAQACGISTRNTKEDVCIHSVFKGIS